MPFTPTGNGKYKSPSGRLFTGKQVRLYYATDGFQKKPKIAKGASKLPRPKSG